MFFDFTFLSHLGSSLRLPLSSSSLVLSCLPELGAVLFAMAGEPVLGELDQVEQNLFAPKCTHESMKTDLTEIGTVEQWSTKYGQMCDHDISVMESVARLLTQGVKQLVFVLPIPLHHPGATRATWVDLHARREPHVQ